MASYILLCNWTDQGVRTAKDSPMRLDVSRDAARAMGGELKHFWMTMGHYDFIAEIEMPDDEAMARFVLAVAKNGAVRTTTLKAFSEDAYRAITGG